MDGASVKKELEKVSVSFGGSYWPTILHCFLAPLSIFTDLHLQQRFSRLRKQKTSSVHEGNHKLVTTTYVTNF